jgi:cytochrome c peroxidase
MFYMKYRILVLLAVVTLVVAFSFKEGNRANTYIREYNVQLNLFKKSQEKLLKIIERSDLQNENDVEQIRTQFQASRNNLKGLDFWFRYFEPTTYKLLNGPLPVEWETELFDSAKKNYKRDGAGLTLAALYLDEEQRNKDSLAQLIKTSLKALAVFSGDAIIGKFASYHHFYLCNRLFLLNLAAIYTTGFECPDTSRVIPELYLMMENVQTVYQSFNESFAATPLPDVYLQRYNDAIDFIRLQPVAYSAFDHFSFIKDYINPLFLLNQHLINQYHVISESRADFTLSKNEITVFNKALYNGQNPKGIFSGVEDEKALGEIRRLGRLLFYDPILSKNNLRSCASCHKPAEFFTDTATATALQFNRKDFLPRNAPSLINVPYNHLLMFDGKHNSLQSQTKGVITTPTEMGDSENEVMEKVLSCNEYRNAFNDLLKYTPSVKDITFDHVVSAITFYYSKFSKYTSPFDEAINNNKPLDASAIKGFNLFMSKALCATCHFVPQFNGVKPPYTNSEFEVIGVPDDTTFQRLNTDRGRYEVNPAVETLNAFRTGTIRNAAHTAPYMHNGIFKNLSQVIDFYDAGGGAGRRLQVDNQTLPSDSLKLTSQEKTNLLHFIESVTENIVFETPPQQLPVSKIKELNSRKSGGEY